MNYLVTDPKCHLDVYEVSDENTWVKCKQAISKASIIISFPIVIIVLILVIYFFNDYKWYVIFGSILFYTGSIFYHYYLLDMMARTEYQTAQEEIKVRMDRGMTKAEAYKSLQEEQLKKAEISQSARNSAAQAAGLLSIARSLK